MINSGYSNHFDSNQLLYTTMVISFICMKLQLSSYSLFLLCFPESSKVLCGPFVLKSGTFSPILRPKIVFFRNNCEETVIKYPCKKCHHSCQVFLRSLIDCKLYIDILYVLLIQHDLTQKKTYFLWSWSWQVLLKLVFSVTGFMQGMYTFEIK